MQFFLSLAERSEDSKQKTNGKGDEHNYADDLEKRRGRLLSAADLSLQTTTKEVFWRSGLVAEALLQSPLVL